MSVQKIVSTWVFVLLGGVALAGFSTPGWSEEASDCPTEEANNFGGEDIGFARTGNRAGNRARNRQRAEETDCPQVEPVRGNTNAERRLGARDTRDDSNEPLANTGDTEMIAGRHSRMSAGTRPGILDEETQSAGSPVADYKDAPENDDEPEEGTDPDGDNDTDEDSDNDTDG